MFTFKEKNLLVDENQYINYNIDHMFYKTLNPCNTNHLDSHVVVQDKNLTHSNHNINFHVTKSKPNLSTNNVNGKVFKNFPKIKY